MQDRPLVSVIIINFNGEKYLKSCLQSLLQGSYRNIEIILVDNGSADGSLAFVRNDFPSVKTIDNKKNLGLAIASNRGAGVARGKYLFFYNNDTIADKFLVEKLVGKMESDPEVGICGCRTYTYDGKSVINEGVACDIFGYPDYLPVRGGIFYVDAAIFIRRALFDELRGFDEKLFLYGEDVDICWRCWLSGYKVEAVAEAVFYHDSACITEDLAEYSTNLNKRFLGEYNSVRSILKNYSLPYLSLILPMYLAINFAEMTAFIFSGRVDVVRGAYLRSYKENLRDLKSTLEERSRVQKSRRISDFELMRHMMKVSRKLSLFFRAGLPGFSQGDKYKADSL